MKLIITLIIALLSLQQDICATPRTWVIFRDRGYEGAEQIRQAIDRETAKLLPATRQRLLKVRSEAALLTESDLPIYAEYLKQIERLTGLKPHALCRAINGASFDFTAEQIVSVRSFPFVRETRPVRAFSRDPDPGDEPLPPVNPGNRFLDSRLDYGSSYTQNALENFIPAHDEGFSGAGVFVGSLDNGWNNLAHRCFHRLEIVAQWDFVHGDSIASGGPGGGTHGTRTLSCLAGYDPGYLIGTAFGVRVALAETESDQYELPIEEDNWAAGIEWLDSLGVVVATSSVSYGTLHTYPELDGNTTVITIAADNAVARGIVVVNSVSNHGTWAYPGDKMSPPSDGDSVLAIGNVQADSIRSSSSSIGPTFDGRIKPDLMALGTGVTVASYFDTVSYLGASGTSFSAPITAGACALLLEANPNLTPMQVHALLKASATRANNPDTLMGWGIYDVREAIQANFSPKRQVPIYPVIMISPNPLTPTARIAFELPGAGNIVFKAYDLTGRLIAVLSQDHFELGRHEVVWNTDKLSSGLYLLRLESPFGVQTRKAILIK